MPLLTMENPVFTAYAVAAALMIRMRRFITHRVGC